MNSYHKIGTVAILALLSACGVDETVDPVDGGADSSLGGGGSVPGTCDPAECPAVGECSERGCDLYGKCSSAPLPKYEKCASGRCDGKGSCVPGMCILKSDCAPPEDVRCAETYCGGDDACHEYDYPLGATCGSQSPMPHMCDGKGSCVAANMVH